MEQQIITCDYNECDSPKKTTWGWVVASNGEKENIFCSDDHRHKWLEKKASSFWDLKNLGSEDVQFGPRTKTQDDNDKLSYTCKFSPHVIEENKQAIIQSLMMQFQGYDISPTIVAPQDSNIFTITMDRGDLNQHEIKEKILNNYFIDSASTRSESKVVRNLRVDLTHTTASKDITSHVMELTKANQSSLANYEKVQWVPTDDVHNIREFNRLSPEHSVVDSRSTVDDLKKSIMEEGFRSPLLVDYNINDRYVYLGEGHHRLIAAQELGLTHVPATVHRSGESYSMGNQGRGYAKEVPGVDPDQHGYVMGQMTPTQVGLTDPSNVRTASTTSIPLTHIKRFDPWHESSVNGQGYDAPVDSNLHAETDQDPQYIIDQTDITDPQRTASWYIASNEPTQTEKNEALSKGINIEDYGFARDFGATHNEALYAHQKGIHLKDYGYAKNSGATHNEVLDAYSKGIKLHNYAYARDSGATHNEALKKLIPNYNPYNDIDWKTSSKENFDEFDNWYLL